MLNNIVEGFNSNIIYYGSRLAVKTQRWVNELFYCKLPSQDINVFADVQYIKVIFLQVFRNHKEVRNIYILT